MIILRYFERKIILSINEIDHICNSSCLPREPNLGLGQNEQILSWNQNQFLPIDYINPILHDLFGGRERMGEQNLLNSSKSYLKHINVMKSMYNNYLVPNYSPQTVLVVKIIIFGQIFVFEKWADSAPPMQNSKNLKYDKKFGGVNYYKSFKYWFLMVS